MTQILHTTKIVTKLCNCESNITSFAMVLQGMIALRRGATELTHEDYMDGILEVQAKKKANLQYYA